VKVSEDVALSTRVVSSQPAGAAGLGFEWLPWQPGWAIWAAAIERLQPASSRGDVDCGTCRYRRHSL
jgi:hypothetical protein